ncbi:uncharacterized protein N7479_010831 [Penicillium vulpinum]|uniref:Uncharacterized protein n=1 Tax=Penicillium vulpinum TaxID=29845 RepID=A0A1V6RZL6_9EURO|nr:uncharacterized protein N7479_010831 [Penicillium vulpinum]KAJ5952418.1 hypothetical protein N7479_010831 [Penicillium vulpinum]OQE07231.1 hypothetical protein PENVUL_c014G04423 [Penicillium vulpinum]
MSLGPSAHLKRPRFIFPTCPSISSTHAISSKIYSYEHIALCPLRIQDHLENSAGLATLLGLGNVENVKEEVELILACKSSEPIRPNRGQEQLIPAWLKSGSE